MPSEVTSEKLARQAGTGKASTAQPARKVCSLKDAKSDVPVPVLEVL